MAALKSTEVSLQVDVRLRSGPRALSQVASIVYNQYCTEQKFSINKKTTSLIVIGTFQVVAIPDSRAGLVVTCTNSRDSRDGKTCHQILLRA